MCENDQCLINIDFLGNIESESFCIYHWKKEQKLFECTTQIGRVESGLDLNECVWVYGITFPRIQIQLYKKWHIKQRYLLTLVWHKIAIVELK